MAAGCRGSGRLLFLLQKHRSCVSLFQKVNQFARIPLQFSTLVQSQKTMTDQSQTDLGLYKPPPTVRGMTELDRAAFSQTVSVPAIRIPTNVLNKAVKSLKKVALQRPGLKRVVEEHSEDGNKDSSEGEHRLLLLDPNSITSADSFGGEEAEALKAYGVPQEIQKYELQLTYENLKSQVIIDKNPGITCVVNKTNTIDSTYRNFQMEVLAGESNMVAKVRENGVFYEFDFSHVYWNPRLSTEHERIVSLLQRGDTVVDVFAGVGPFAIPAARRGCEVLANDLNPESFRWLQHNAKLNKVDRKITSFNMDGRNFIRGPVEERLPALMKGSQKIHVVMNLPALALEFLDAFRGLLGPEPDQSLDNLPQVHCYGFSKEDDAQRDVVERAEASLKTSLQGQCSVHLVRNVAPNKEMMCVSFTLPRGVLYSTHTKDSDVSEEPNPKKQKCEDPTD
ncbi:hypothetical protein cypCar_00019719 [Cyprinus carpio]|nr:hypothetical protein cypCar_00019719 [Cyprinus carpio]